MSRVLDKIIKHALGLTFIRVSTAKNSVGPNVPAGENQIMKNWLVQVLSKNSRTRPWHFWLESFDLRTSSSGTFHQNHAILFGIVNSGRRNQRIRSFTEIRNEGASREEATCVDEIGNSWKWDSEEEGCFNILAQHFCDNLGALSMQQGIFRSFYIFMHPVSVDIFVIYWVDCWVHKI